MNIKARKLISFDELLPKFGITDSRTTLRRKMEKDPPQFPQCVRSASGSRINWWEHEVYEHLASLERGNAENFRAKKKSENPDFGRSSA